MNSWVNLHALWKIVVLGLVAGAGLPALFAVGLKSLSAGGTSTGDTAKLASGSQAGLIGAVACFAVVVAAIAYGIYLVVDAS